MRSIGHLQDETQARRFADFLDGEGVENQVDPGPQNSWEVWVLDDAHVDRAMSLLDEFRRASRRRRASPPNRSSSTLEKRCLGGPA